MMNEDAFLELEEQHERSWSKKALLWSAAAIVPTALMVNMTAPTLKTLAAERVYAQVIEEQQLVREFTTLSKHVLPNSSVHAIAYLNLPAGWHVETMTINGVVYSVDPGFDSYLFALTTPNELGHWTIALEALNVFDGSLYHEVSVNHVAEIDVETHIPHFEEVHPEKPKVQQDHSDAGSDGASDDYHADGKVKVDQKIDQKVKAGADAKASQVDKYALTDEKNLFKKVVKLPKVQVPTLPEHGNLVAVFIQETLYPAKMLSDGSLEVFGVPNGLEPLHIQYFVYEDGYLAPAGL